jgi:hypothetical protein
MMKPLGLAQGNQVQSVPTRYFTPILLTGQAVSSFCLKFRIVIWEERCDTCERLRDADAGHR